MHTTPRLHPGPPTQQRADFFCVMCKGNDFQATKNWREAIAIDPKYKEAHINLGLSLRAKGDVFRASCYFELNWNVCVKGKSRQAIQHYQNALRCDPACKEARVNLGVAFALLNQTEQALEQYQQTLEVDPEYSVAHYNMGLLLLKLDQLPEAEAHFRCTIPVRCSVATHVNESAADHVCVRTKPTHRHENSWGQF